MRISHAATMVTLASLAAAACGARPPAPEPVPVDHVECARCGMLISTERGAAEIVSASGETRFYDDIGCAIADWKRNRDDSAHVFVMDQDHWVDGAAAWYAETAPQRTAMGSGLAAFARADAARTADKNGRALTWQDVTASQSEPGR